MDRALMARIDARFRPVWEQAPDGARLPLARYFLRLASAKPALTPERPRVVKWYCPFARQHEFPSGHRYCINVYTGCAHRCVYCYAAAYEPERHSAKADFVRKLHADLNELERFDVPPAPVHLSVSTDPFQQLEHTHRHTRAALEGLLAHRKRFTSVVLVTKNPALAAEDEYVELLTALNRLPPDHPRAADFQARGLPGVRVEVSLAFGNDAAQRIFDPGAPSLAARRDGIRRLATAGIPVVIRIDPLFPRSPLPTAPPSSLPDYGLPEAQPLRELDEILAFARATGVRHVVYSALKIVRPRTRPPPEPMLRMLKVYRALAAPDAPPWRGGSWRLPREVADRHVFAPFLDLCRHHDLAAKFCMTNLIETP